jgi:hypothetical protein
MITPRYFAAATQAAWQSTWWVTGGFDGVSALNSTENFNVGTGFTQGVNLPIATFKHNIGATYGSGGPSYLLFGGNDTAHQSQTWLVDWTTGKASQTAPPQFPTSYTGGVTWDGVYGWASISCSSGGCQLFLSNQTWIKPPQLTQNLATVEASADLNYDALYVLGGTIGGIAQSMVYRYSTGAVGWNPRGNMAKARVGHAAFVVPDKYCN